MVTRIPRYRQAKETKCGEMDGREPERLILPRQPRSAQILTADSVQQQPIAAPEGSEINHGIHRNTRKRESESTSPFRVLPGGNFLPVGWGRSVVTHTLNLKEVGLVLLCLELDCT